MTNTFTNPKPATWSAIAQRVAEREHSHCRDEPEDFQPITIEEARASRVRFWNLLAEAA
jgi:hypothetical protein